MGAGTGNSVGKKGTKRAPRKKKAARAPAKKGARKSKSGKGKPAGGARSGAKKSGKDKKRDGKRTERAKETAGSGPGGGVYGGQEPGELWAATIQEACELLGIARATFYNHREEPGFPPPDAGQGWPLQRLREWFERAGILGGEDEDETISRGAETARKLRAQRQLLEIELAQRRREVVGRDEARGELVRLARLFVAGLQDMVDELTARIRDKRVTEIAEQVMANVRERMCERVGE